MFIRWVTKPISTILQIIIYKVNLEQKGRYSIIFITVINLGA